MIDLKTLDLSKVDVIVLKNVHPDDAMDMLAGCQCGRDIPVVCLREDQDLTTLTDEELAGLGLQRIPK